MATQRKRPTSATQWKTKAQHEVDLPSGNTCLARRPGLQVFLEAGIIPNSLLPLVQQALKGKQTDPKDLLEDLTEERLREIVKLYDAVTCYVVIEPEVHQAPLREDGTTVPWSERDGDKLYVDEVDFEDKQFLFQWSVGGTRDLERFRQEQEAVVADLSAGEDVGSSPERTDGDQR